MIVALAILIQRNVLNAYFFDESVTLKAKESFAHSSCVRYIESQTILAHIVHSMATFVRDMKAKQSFQLSDL